MAGYSAIQFNGPDAVVRAYQQRAVAAWGLFCEKDFMASYNGKSIDEGVNQLNGWLEMLSESVAVYTLKVYENVEVIKDKTACDGSFRFRLKQREEGAGSSWGMQEMYREQKREIADLKRQLAEQATGDDDDDDEEKDSVGAILGTITQVLQLPGVGEFVAGIFRRSQPQIQQYGPGVGALGTAMHPEMSVQPGSSMGASNSTVPADTSMLQAVEIPESELERLGSCYASLRSRMPGCLELLEKLATMSIQDPGKFEGIKAMIKTFI